MEDKDLFLPRRHGENKDLFFSVPLNVLSASEVFFSL